MELFAIKEQLSDYKLAVYGNQDLSIDIRMIKLLSKQQKKFHKHIIYLAPTDILPPPDTSGEFTILCYGTAPCWSSFKNSSFRILYMEDSLDYIGAFNKIQEVMQNIDTINSGLYMLINAFFEEKGLQYIADIAYQVFGNPIYIVDNSYKYLAVSSGIVADNVFASDENRAGYISTQGIEFIKSSKLDDKIRNQKSPVYFHNPLHKKGMMADAITINNIEVGHVMLYELDKPFNEFDSILLHRTSRIISMELQKNSFITSNKGLMYSYFLADLIDNPNINYASVKERISVLGYDLKDDQYMLVIPSHSYHNANIRLDIIVEQLHKILHNSIYVIYQNTIAILISRSRKDGISEYELNRLVEFLKANNLTAGMSNFFTDLKHTKKFYHQALKSVELGLKLGIQSVIHRYSDYYIYHLFEMCEKKEDIHFFIHPGIIKLLQYDKKHGTDFVNTLREYLETPGQPAQTAKRLHIHKNTLLYRMDKIRSIMNCKIDSGDEYMSFGLSIKIMKYLNMI